MDDYHKECCKKYLEFLMKEPMTVPLRHPVDPVKDHCPTYLDIIKNPMDLSTMKKKLNQNKYPSLQAFIDDIQLICDNAATFNGKASMLAMVGEDLMRETEEWRQKIYSSKNQAWYENMVKCVSNLERNLEDAPPSITFGPSLDLPEDFDINSILEDDKEAIKKLIEPFEIEKFRNIWAFISKQNKEKILEIIKKEKNSN